MASPPPRGCASFDRHPAATVVATIRERMETSSPITFYVTRQLSASRPAAGCRPRRARGQYSMAIHDTFAPAAARPPHETTLQLPIAYGRERLPVEIDPGRLVALERAEAPPPLADPVGAVRAALESPLRYPALRRALTPDDHVTVVVDEHLPRLPELVNAVLEHVLSAGVDPAAITLLCPPSASRQPWLDALPEAVEEVHTE